MSWEGDRLIRELEEAGWSVYRIAERLDRKWDTVNRWRTVEPRYSDAQAVIALHAEVVQRSGIPVGGLTSSEIAK